MTWKWKEKRDEKTKAGGCISETNNDERRGYEGRGKKKKGRQREMVTWKRKEKREKKGLERGGLNESERTMREGLRGEREEKEGEVKEQRDPELEGG